MAQVPRSHDLVAITAVAASLRRGTGWNQKATQRRGYNAIAAYGLLLTVRSAGLLSSTCALSRWISVPWLLELRRENSDVLLLRGDPCFEKIVASLAPKPN